MTQIIKHDDLVYIPSITFKLQKVIKDRRDLLIVYTAGREIYRINPEGHLYSPHKNDWHIQPFAFLATPENKEKLEQVYGGLEDIPNDDEQMRGFIGKLNELSVFYAK